MWKSIGGWVCTLVILGFVALVLVPFPCQPREKARQTACLSNMRQIGLALAQYETDNDQRLPAPSSTNGAVTWRRDMYPYLGTDTLYNCPSRPEVHVGPDGLSTDYSVIVSKHGLFPSEHSGSPSLSEVKDPDELILLCESDGYGNAIDIDNPHQDPLAIGLWAGHMNGMNVVFADGHAKRMRPQDTDAHKANPSAKPINFWYVDGSTPLSAAGQWRLAHPATELSPLR